MWHYQKLWGGRETWPPSLRGSRQTEQTRHREGSAGAFTAALHFVHLKCPVFYLRGSPWCSCPKFSPVRGYNYLMYCSTICWFLWEGQRDVSPKGGKGQKSFARGFREAPALSYTRAFPEVFPPFKGIKVPWISSLRKSASHRNNGQVSAEFKDFSGEAQRAKSSKAEPGTFCRPLGEWFFWSDRLILSASVFFCLVLKAFAFHEVPKRSVCPCGPLKKAQPDPHHFGKPQLTSSSYFSHFPSWV